MKFICILINIMNFINHYSETVINVYLFLLSLGLRSVRGVLDFPVCSEPRSAQDEDSAIQS